MMEILKAILIILGVAFLIACAVGPFLFSPSKEDKEKIEELP